MTMSRTTRIGSHTPGSARHRTGLPVVIRRHPALSRSPPVVIPTRRCSFLGQASAPRSPRRARTCSAISGPWRSSVLPVTSLGDVAKPACHGRPFIPAYELIVRPPCAYVGWRLAERQIIELRRSDSFRFCLCDSTTLTTSSTPSATGGCRRTVSPSACPYWFNHVYDHPTSLGVHDLSL